MNELVRKVLLVEDNAADAALLEDYLAFSPQAQTLRLQHEQTLEAALHRIESEAFDLVLLDLNLTDSQNLNTAIRMRKAAGDTPIVVLTGIEDEAVAVQALQNGVQDYLVKGSIDARTLARSIRYAIERNQVEMQLRQSQRMEAIGLLAGGVAHDFRNQLQVIMGFGEMLLRDDLVKKEGRTMLEQILKAAKRSATTTGKLLAYGRREMLHPIVQSVRDCVAEAGTVLPHMIDADIRLVIQSSNEDDKSRFDWPLLQQAIMNLATNARDAMPEGGTLSIETACVTLSEAQSRQIDPELAAGQYVVVSVSDTGSGMDKATLARVFDPYFTTKDVSKGSGLGLPMVYGFVKQTGGAIAIQSEPGHGATVRLYFPRIVSASVDSVVRQDAGALHGGNETILAVDDEASVLSVATELLRKAGYRVLTASSTEEALAIVEQHDSPLDLLVADIVMPGMNGAVLAERLCRLYPGMGVLYMPPGERVFACRQCHRLLYASQTGAGKAARS
ncbi:MAG: response regulator [Planctomycetota bacterium]|nr:response regulator [Planctomycetota bacterium]